jgi:hypothetical protein
MTKNRARNPHILKPMHTSRTSAIQQTPLIRLHMEKNPPSTAPRLP